MPMMAKTTINSIKVNPRCLRTALRSMQGVSAKEGRGVFEFSKLEFMAQSLSAISDTSPS
jgi:hypothetical protein